MRSVATFRPGHRRCRSARRRSSRSPCSLRPTQSDPRAVETNRSTQRAVRSSSLLGREKHALVSTPVSYLILFNWFPTEIECWPPAVQKPCSYWSYCGLVVAFRSFAGFRRAAAPLVAATVNLGLLRGTLCGDRVQEGSDQERMEGGRKDSGWQVSFSYLGKIQFNWTMKTTWVSVIVVELSYYHCIEVFGQLSTLLAPIDDHLQPQSSFTRFFCFRGSKVKFLGNIPNGLIPK